MRTKSSSKKLSSDFIKLQLRSGEEEDDERCGASVKTDDDAWTGCGAMKPFDSFSEGSKGR